MGVRPAVGSATTPPAEVVKETASTGRLQKTPRWVRKYADNAALSQNFAPVENEISLHDLKVTGKLPPHLDGVYLRNGPNPAFEPIKEYHWFGARLSSVVLGFENICFAPSCFSCEVLVLKPTW